MIGALRLLADSGPSIHIAPGTVFQIDGVNISNSILYGWICITLLCIFAIWVARQVTIRPKGGVIQYVEAAVDFIVNLVENAFDDPAIGRKYVPFFVTLFCFILFNNWLGLLPIVGDGFQVNGHPFLRPFTGDLSATLALGVVTMTVVYVSSIRESGFRHYIRHFFVGSPWNPLYFFIGILEMFTDLVRVFSLSLRLFLNVTIGEILIAVFSYLGHIAAPLTSLPFTLLELGVGALQAYIFTILGVMYLAIAVNAAHAHEAEDESLTEEANPERIVNKTTEGVASGQV